jgi:hypothetical protein
MDEETKKIFDSLKGGLPNVKDENKGGHHHSPPDIPDLDFKREGKPVRDSIEYVVSTGRPTPTESAPDVHHNKPIENPHWQPRAFDSHKGGTNVFNKGGKK